MWGLLLWGVLAQAEPMKLQNSAACTLQAVASRKRIQLRADAPLPTVFLESETPLVQYQDAVEPQWGFRPERFLNVFVAALNEIYLINDAGFYVPRGRFVDDSLAHELAHYLQVVYENADPLNGDSLETEAVAVQTWYREMFMQTGSSPCEAIHAM